VNVRHDKIAVFVARPTADGAGHEFLHLRRAADEWLGGTWQTVRGTIESGETAIAAALRELREETSLAPAEFYRLGTIETFYDGSSDSIVHSVPFLAMVGRNAAVMLNAEHDAQRWVPADEVENAFMWPSEKPILREVRTEFFGNGACKPLLLIRP
jgi:8-oxo-dGTP pyrophosphatase MutT (NUDIX family)